MPAASGVLALVALALLGVAFCWRCLGLSDCPARAGSAARAETSRLCAYQGRRGLARRLSTAPWRPLGPARPEFVITGSRPPRRGGGAEPAGARGQPGALFADLVLRETVVKAASLAHGVRRALDPETRNRIRFEMRREVEAGPQAAPRSTPARPAASGRPVSAPTSTRRRGTAA